MKKFQHMISIYLIVGAIFLVSNVLARQNHQHARKYSTYPDYDNDLSLWINEAQVKRFSGKMKNEQPFKKEHKEKMYCCLQFIF